VSDPLKLADERLTMIASLLDKIVLGPPEERGAIDPLHFQAVVIMSFQAIVGELMAQRSKR
jgi:hypothetical protein